MDDTRGSNDTDYESMRGDPVASIDNLIRWEQIKLRDAARDAIQLLEGGALPTREYLDFMFNSDIGMRELRARIAKHRERLRELEALRDDAKMSIPAPHATAT